MTEETLKTFLHDLNVDLDYVTYDGEFEFQCPCPLAPWTHERGTDNKPSLSISIESDPPLYYCFACKSKGRLTTLLKQYAEASGKILHSKRYFSQYASLRPRTKIKKVFKEMPLPTSLLENFFDYREFETAVQYLESRSIDLLVADEYQLKYDPDRDMIVFPIFNQQENFMGAVGRSISGEKRYHNYFNAKLAATLGGINKLKEPKRIFIVEGFFDLLSCAPWVTKYSGGVVCTWKSDLSDGQAALLSSFDAVMCCAYDADKAGDRGWKSIRTFYGTLAGNLCRRIIFPDGQDVNDLCEEEFDECYQNSLKGRLV